jgi:predicted protein tyrosine phosphatase
MSKFISSPHFMILFSPSEFFFLVSTMPSLSMQQIKVAPHIFLSDVRSAQELKLLESNSIRLVISLGSEKAPLPEFLLSVPCKQHFIKIDDDESADILIHFEKACRLIASSIKDKENVLIHCDAGISRSTTLYLSYFMKNESLSFEDALPKLQELYPQAYPNAGFEIQLELWREMEFTYLPDHYGYRRWKLSRMSCQVYPKFFLYFSVSRLWLRI